VFILIGFGVKELGHSVCNDGLFGSKDFAGFLYVRPTYHCLRNLVLPQTPYLIGIMILQSELIWAKMLPLRLMLCLGADSNCEYCLFLSVNASCAQL
jgi:MAD, mothers against decapentaplegic interacting protein